MFANLFGGWSVRRGLGGPPPRGWTAGAGHGSRFDASSRVVHGPAEKQIRTYRVQLKDGRVLRHLHRG